MPSPRQTALAEETRRLLLEAAEAEFAEKGFAAGRLEDIAARVGMTRPAVIYHFRDKRVLYDAALTAAFSELRDRIEEAADSAGSATERVMAVVDAWVDCSLERPTLARLFMRETADAEDGFRPEVADLIGPLYARILDIVERGRGPAAATEIDAGHFVTILAGATTWHATSAHLMTPGAGSTQSNAERYEAYRTEIKRVCRFLLGTAEGGTRS